MQANSEGDLFLTLAVEMQESKKRDLTPKIKKEFEKSITSDHDNYPHGNIMALEADKKIAHGSSENSRLFPAMVSDDGPEDKRILFAGTLDRLDQGVNKISEQIIEISHNDNSLIVDKKQNEE